MTRIAINRRLLGAAAIVWISTGPARQHPIATAWTLRRKS